MRWALMNVGWLSVRVCVHVCLDFIQPRWISHHSATGGRAQHLSQSMFPIRSLQPRIHATFRDLVGVNV